MDTLRVAIEMLDTLRPRIWKTILSSLVIVGMVSIPLYKVLSDFDITGGEVLLGAVGVAALVVVWFDYHFSMRIYRKFQETLISMTEPGKSW
jgi:hypothetical protein